MSLYWTLLLVFVTKHFLPAMGLQSFAPFVLISSVISYGFFMGMQNAISLVDDITSDQSILYELSLPINQSLVFFKYALSTMIQSLTVSLAILPCGMLVLMDYCPFKDFSTIKFIAIFLCSSIFYGCFFLVLSSILKNMHQIDNVWMRIVFPIWYLGCSQFPWKTLKTVSPAMAYADFLNPMTFIMEGARSATIDAQGSLNFTFCCSMILLYAAISCIVGIWCMKKRLDCIR